VNLSKLNRILLQTLLLPVVALMIVSGVLVYQVLNAEQTVARIQLADDNIATANYISALIADQETGIRGYQNTSNEIFLQPYDMAAAPLQENINRLRDGIAAQGGDLHAIDDLTEAHEIWLDTIARPMIAIIRAGGNTRDPAINLRGKAVMDQIRAITTVIVNEQKNERSYYAEHWRDQVRHTLEGAIGFSILIGLAIGLFARSRLHMVSHAFQTALDALRGNAQATYESEQRLRATLTSIGDAVVVCDVEGRVELLNTVAQQLTGWRQEEALLQPIDKVFPIIDETTREPMETPFALVKRLNRVIGSNTRAVLIRRDATELHIDNSGAPIYDFSGNLAGVVIVFRDISEQRRTLSALIASEKLAVAGRLAASIAHEIHNPLDAVVNLIYLLKSGVTPEENEQFLDMASSELARVTQISRAMLGMYRESRSPVAVDLMEVLGSVLVLLDRRLIQHGITVRTEVFGEAIVTGFPAELRQVFTNLISNAIDASSSGSTLELTVRKQAPNRSRVSGPAGVTVALTDHGGGIGEADLDQIFQPFFTTKGEHGTGLGLWVSQGIIHKHGGTIHVDTKTDPATHGTTITVFLPRGEAQLVDTTQPPTA
jgi:PAS domain S-box-containing protein